jgi:rRNA maturation endonuclease Nob1
MRSHQTDVLQGEVMPVVDTAALLHWPIERLRGCIAAYSQLQELERLSPPRVMLVEAAGLEWRTEPVALAQEAAAKTGDLARLSQVDLEVLALTIATGEVLHTDDYSLQNVCRAQGLSFAAVSNKSSKEQWRWQLRCTGCKAKVPVTSKEPRDCDICGSPMLVKRAR